MSNLDLFTEELTKLINTWSLENGPNMPDHAIANYLRRAYENLCTASDSRVDWGQVLPKPAPIKVTWGHGHVYPRIDGMKARCGGPGICSECSRDQSALNKGEGVRAYE